MSDDIEIIDVNNDDLQINQINLCLDDIETFMKTESKNRKNMIREATDSLDNHSKKLIEYNQKLKEYEKLSIQYKNLLEKNKQNEQKLKQIIEYREELDSEVLHLKKQVVKLAKDNETLKLILKTLIDKAGIDLIAASTKMPIDKLKEYLN